MNSTVLSYFPFFSPLTRSLGGSEKGNSKDAPKHHAEFPNQTEVLETPWATYRLLEIVGKGAFGLVVSANVTYDQCGCRSTKPVAIKRVSQIFSDISNTKSALREVRILRYLDHVNIVSLLEVSCAQEKGSFNDIYLITDLMECDLAMILKNATQPILDSHAKFFMYQILRAMTYVHSANIMHRDLKPRNILVNSNCDLKICDFGLAKIDMPAPLRRGRKNTDMFDDEQHAPNALTEYVCTRWYRAPEILTCNAQYTKMIDVWSIACIFAALLNRRTLFEGDNSRHQLKLILQLLGCPSDKGLKTMDMSEICRSFCRKYAAENTNPVRLEDKFPDSSACSIDLLQKLLRFVPEQRLSVADALAHPYLEDFYCAEDEPTTVPMDLNEFVFDRKYVPIEELREELFGEQKSYCSSHKCGDENCESLSDGASRNVERVTLQNSSDTTSTYAASCPNSGSQNSRDSNS